MADYIKDLRKLVGTRPLMLPGATVILLDEQKRILLQHRTDNGLWGLPGGIMELGETVEEAAKREVYEETGLTVLSLKLFGVYSGSGQYYKYPNGDEAFHVAVTFIADRFEGCLHIDGDESRDLKFFGPGSLPVDIVPPDKPIIEDYIKIIMSKGL